MERSLVSYSQEGLEPIRWTSRWQQFFLFATPLLATTILLKYQGVQYLEWLYLLQIGLITLHFIKDDLRSVWFKPFLAHGLLYSLFSIIAFALALAALRFRFYLPPTIPVPFLPVYVTIIREVELFASVFIMLALADLFRNQPNKLRFSMRIYFWTGVASAVYCYISYPLFRFGIGEYGVYLDTLRFRGFYNEGGPYGLYLITVFLVGGALYALEWETKLRLCVGFALLPVAFVFSASKAAFSATLTLLLLNALLARGFGRRVLILGGMATLFVIASRTSNLQQMLSFSSEGNQSYERISHIRAGDSNFVYGRIAGAFIVPRMIKAHPYSGIGWGNYGTLRNEPEYRGASYFAEIADSPGLGLLGYAAELGLPNLGLLLICLLFPWFCLLKLRSPLWLSNLAIAQPLVHIFGAQLNVTYPWVVTAFAFGMGYSFSRTRKLHATPSLHRLSWKEGIGTAEGLNGSRTA